VLYLLFKVMSKHSVNGTKSQKVCSRCVVFFRAIKKDLNFFKSLIYNGNSGGASRIRTADLWIMMKKFIKKSI
jgi:hypothetical protein